MTTGFGWAPLKRQGTISFGDGSGVWIYQDAYFHHKPKCKWWYPKFFKGLILEAYHQGIKTGTYHGSIEGEETP